MVKGNKMLPLAIIGQETLNNIMMSCLKVCSISSEEKIRSRSLEVNA